MARFYSPDNPRIANTLPLAGVTAGQSQINKENLVGNRFSSLSKRWIWDAYFPAEFGNVISGIFDLRFRNGNNRKYEFLVSTGFNGVELGAEGSLLGSDASYIVNGRYSFLDLLILGVPMQSLPKYQDVSAKINIPLKPAIVMIERFALWSGIFIFADTS